MPPHPQPVSGHSTESSRKYTRRLLDVRFGLHDIPGKTPEAIAFWREIINAFQKILSCWEIYGKQMVLMATRDRIAGDILDRDKSEEI